MPDRGPSSGHYLFTPLAHPILFKLGRKSIHTFLKERETYLLRMQDVKTSGGTIDPVSVKASVDQDLLLSPVEFGEVGVSVIDFKNISDEVHGKVGIEVDSLSATDLETS